MNVSIKRSEKSGLDTIYATIKGKPTPIARYSQKKNFILRQATDTFWKYKGFGLPVDVIEKVAEIYGDDTALITVAPNKKASYVAKLGDWKTRSIEVSFGYGRQYILPMADQKEIKNKEA